MIHSAYGVPAKAYEKVTFSIRDLATRTEPDIVLMCSPEYFDVVDVKNVHMQGNAGRVDRKRAVSQWSQIREHYAQLATSQVIRNAMTIAGQPDLEDMVFAANQSLPWLINNEKVVIMSRMRHPSRQREVPFFEKFYIERGYRILQLNETDRFEGMGDTIPHPGKALLYGGCGPRTNRKAYDEISTLLNVPVVLLDLVDPRFYHLDTCFVPLDASMVMVCPEAFSFESFRNIEVLFKRVIRIPAAEAECTFSLNAHVITNGQMGKRVAMLHYGSVHTYQALKDTGFEIIEVDTSEFMKSGGSVFCMKMMIY